VKTRVLESFLSGMVVGIGATLLILYARKPGCLATGLEALSEMAREREEREGEERLQRERLKAMGYSDEEIEDVMKTPISSYDDELGWV